MKKILFVCLGNICRSPTADGVLKKLISDYETKTNKKLDIFVDSAGTGNWHVGDPPDPRSIACAKKNGIDISKLKARTFSHHDFNNFDEIYVMDKSNLNNVLNLADKPEEKEKVKLLLSLNHDSDVQEVPDPYLDKDEGFQQVFDLIFKSCEQILVSNV